MSQEEVSQASVDKAITAPEDAATPAVDVSISDLRLQKIKQYQREALVMLPPEEANVGANTGGLMFVTMQLETAIMIALAERTNSFDKVQQVLPAINTLIQCERQQDRLVRLGHELRRERSQEKKAS